MARRGLAPWTAEAGAAADGAAAPDGSAVTPAGTGGYWHPGHWRGGVWYNGWWGPAVAAGVLLGAAAAYPYYGYGYYDTCWQNRPVYSPSGVYLGYQMVNVSSS